MNTPWVNGYCPVISVPRYGEHTGHPDTVFTQFTLSCANASMRGVFTFGSPI